MKEFIIEVKKFNKENLIKKNENSNKKEESIKEAKRKYIKQISFMSMSNL